MPATAPRDSVIATVGDGFGSLLVHTTARYLGFENQISCRSSGRATIRSAPISSSHTTSGRPCCARSPSRTSSRPDWPTFAQLDAWSHKSFKPLWRTTRRKYNPGVPEILTEAAVVTRRTNWDQARVPFGSAGCSVRCSRSPHFVMYDEQANFIGAPKHVMLAPGHGPLSFPPLLAKARKDPALADRIVQAYEPKQYAQGGRYIVLGRGHRLGQRVGEHPRRRRVGVGAHSERAARDPGPNVPRCLFESIGIDAYTRLPFDQRIEFLGQVLRGTRPDRRQWLSRIKAGQQRGAVRRDRRRDRQDRAGPRRSEGVRQEQERRGSGLARRDRRHRWGPDSTSPC